MAQRFSAAVEVSSRNRASAPEGFRSANRSANSPASLPSPLPRHLPRASKPSQHSDHPQKQSDIAPCHPATRIAARFAAGPPIHHSPPASPEVAATKSRSPPSTPPAAGTPHPATASPDIPAPQATSTNEASSALSIPSSAMFEKSAIDFNCCYRGLNPQPFPAPGHGLRVTNLTH